MLPAGDISRELEALLGRYSAMVRSVARQRGLDACDIDEVLQDVRLRLWRSIEANQGVSKASTAYIYRTAVSAALDCIRRRRRAQAGSLTITSSWSVIPPSNDSSDRRVERKELGTRIEEALSALDARRAAAVSLYLSGYALRESATLLGWTDAQTRNLLYRGLEDLRRVLRERGIGPEIAP
jgi:RNA polymerase sigma-70 factor (ECF subfamily)